MEFVCPDPAALVRGANVLATIEAFGAMPSLAQHFMEKSGMQLRDLRPDNFIPVQKWLDALKAIHGEVGPILVQNVGARIVENADFPPIFGSAEAVLEALDTIYYANHRGNVGHYFTQKNADGSLSVRCETPYPRAFERGLVEGICRNHRLAKGTRYRVRYEDGPANSHVTCLLHVGRLP